MRATAPTTKATHQQIKNHQGKYDKRLKKIQAGVIENTSKIYKNPLKIHKNSIIYHTQTDRKDVHSVELLEAGNPICVSFLF